MSSTKTTAVILLFVSQSGRAQTIEDRSKIYNIVIQEFSDKALPIVNETFTRIYTYDIDGDYEKWFHQSGKPVPDTSIITGRTICVIPTRYAQSVTDFLHSMRITSDPTSFLNQANETKLDSLSRYIVAYNLISWRKAPLAHSVVGNLFKKRKVVGLSQIFFDKKNNLALVKLQVYSKNSSPVVHPSRLIILHKTDRVWKVIGVLDEKQQPTAG
jgi:hypothetical protein